MNHSDSQRCHTQDYTQLINPKRHTVDYCSIIVMDLIVSDKYWIYCSLKFHKVSTSSNSACITWSLHWQWLYWRYFALHSLSITKKSRFVNTGARKHQFSHSTHYAWIHSELTNTPVSHVIVIWNTAKHPGSRPQVWTVTTAAQMWPRRVYYWNWAGVTVGLQHCLLTICFCLCACSHFTVAYVFLACVTSCRFWLEGMVTGHCGNSK